MGHRGPPRPAGGRCRDWLPFDRPRPVEASQTPNWLCAVHRGHRARAGSGAIRSNSIFNPCRQVASVNGCGLREQIVSTAWSIARMPVDSHSHSGVCTVRRRSRMTACAPINQPV